jgi:outer membrane lipoprotein
MRARPVVWLWIILLAAGCAGVISENLRTQAAVGLEPEQVLDAPAAHQGTLVIWGGEIVGVRNTKNGAVLELLHRPVDARDRPRRDRPPGRRFLVEHDRFLDPQVFRAGLDLTVAGEIDGVRTRPLDEIEYPYPVVRARELHLWEPGAGSPVRFGIGIGFGTVITH